MKLVLSLILAVAMLGGCVVVPWGYYGNRGDGYRTYRGDGYRGDGYYRRDGYYDGYRYYGYRDRY
jgi:hypothetical protein